MHESDLRICVFGLGEAGGLISADLASAGNIVNGFDPRPVVTPAGVIRFDSASSALSNTDLVVALTAAADAMTALDQAFDDIPPSALYADFSTSSAETKRRLAARCAGRGILFADVAIMAIVPGKGIRVPTLVSGTGADKFVAVFREFGMPAEPVSAFAGDAATRKLLRSVMMKGLAAVVIEAMQAAEKAGCVDWLWRNLAEEIAAADATTLGRLVQGTQLHAKRRLQEMQASSELLQSLGVEPLMTEATVENLRRILREWPTPGGVSGAAGQNLPAWWRVL